MKGRTNMIIIGYQGIGKSTLSKNQFNIFIDLESSNFFFEKNGMLIRDPNWYIPYCKIANHLSEQGFIVFVSSHKVVRDELKKSKRKVVAIYPALELKDQWIKKLRNRYNETGLEKDYKALANAEDRYEENIKEIIDDVEDSLVINDINYDLEDIIQVYFAEQILKYKENN